MRQLLRPAPLLTLAALALALSACLWTPPFGLFLLAILLSWTVKYSIVVLDAQISGTDPLPVLSVDMILTSLRHWRLLLTLGLVVLFFFAASSTLGLYSRVLLVLLAATVPVVLPAVLAVQAWTHSTEQALRPAIGIGIARLLGADYLRLVATCAVLVLIVALVATRIPVLPVRIAVYLGCWFAMLLRVGEVIRARRDALTAATFFPVPADLTMSAEALATARERAADEIYAHWRNGATLAAWNAAERYAKASTHPAEELLWLQRRASHWNATALEERIAAALRDIIAPS
jgi:hypothetical protein